MKISYKSIIWVFIFAVAMGFVEASVVVYLREIYYPGGFVFPLKPISVRDLLVEITREASTLVMLLAIGIVAGKNCPERFAFFLLSFGIWDLAYYVFLKLILGWPLDLFTRDILFLLPVPWVGPVWAPCVLSATMIILSGQILRLENGPGRAVFTPAALVWLIVGSLMVIASFVEEPLRHHFLPEANGSVYIPAAFAWWLFGAGEVAILAGMGFLTRASRVDTAPAPGTISE